MKHSMSGFVAILLLLSMSGSARAEEYVSTVAGFKTWINSWKSEKADSENMKSSTIALVGWAAEVEFSNHVFAGASYLLSVTDYKFDQATVATSVERNDLDLVVGYQFNHNIGIFTGYRSSQFMEKFTKSKVTRHGPLVGIRGAASLNDTLSLFGNWTYLPMSNKETSATTDERETARGWFAEAGVKYAFTKQFAGALGYKYETTRGKNTEVTDVFAGTTLAVMYAF